MTTPSSPVCNESSDDITGRVTRSGNLYVSPCHLPAPLLLLLPHLFLLRCGQALLCTMQFPENRGEERGSKKSCGGGLSPVTQHHHSLADHIYHLELGSPLPQLLDDSTNVKYGQNCNYHTKSLQSPKIRSVATTLKPLTSLH